MNDVQEFPLPAITHEAEPAAPSEAEQLATAAKHPLSMLNDALLTVIDDQLRKLTALRELVVRCHTRSLDQVDSHAAIVPLVRDVVSSTDHVVETIKGKMGA